MNRTTVRDCDWCGEKFTAQWNYAKNRFSVYCSTSCATTAAHQRHREERNPELATTTNWAIPDTDTTWMARAACADHPDPDAWYPVAGTPAFNIIDICKACPVRIPCLHYALTIERGERKQRWGLWGALNPEQRHTLDRA